MAPLQVGIGYRIAYADRTDFGEWSAPLPVMEEATAGVLHYDMEDAKKRAVSGSTLIIRAQGADSRRVTALQAVMEEATAGVLRYDMENAKKRAVSASTLTL
jgi:hypothetical protein